MLAGTTHQQAGFTITGNATVDAFLQSGDIRRARPGDLKDNRNLSQSEAVHLMNLQGEGNPLQPNYLDHGTDNQRDCLGHFLTNGTGCEWKNKKQMQGTGIPWFSKGGDGKHLIGIVVSATHPPPTHHPPTTHRPPTDHPPNTHRPPHGYQNPHGFRNPHDPTRR